MERQTTRHSWGSSNRSVIQPEDRLDGRLSPVADVENSSGNEDEAEIAEKQDVWATPFVLETALTTSDTHGFSYPWQPTSS